MADQLSTDYKDLLDGRYDCIDRIVLNAYFSLGYSAGGFRCWWRRLHDGSEENLDNAHLMRMAGRFSRRVRAFAEVHSQRPRIHRLPSPSAGNRLYQRGQLLHHHFPACRPDPSRRHLVRSSDCRALEPGLRALDLHLLLCFALELEEQQRSGFGYQYSVYQSEYSRNLVFHSGAQMEQIFQALIDRTRAHLNVKRLKTIFGFKARPHRDRKGKKPPRLEVVIETPAYDLTIFKLHFGKLTLKAYTKGERVLRFEAIVHNTSDSAETCSPSLKTLASQHRNRQTFVDPASASA
jgi:hypothetical protein